MKQKQIQMMSALNILFLRCQIYFAENAVILKVTATRRKKYLQNIQRKNE